MTPRQNIVSRGCATSGAVEVTPSKQIRRKDKTPAKTEVYACPQFADSRLVVVESRTNQIIQADLHGDLYRFEASEPRSIGRTAIFAAVRLSDTKS